MAPSQLVPNSIHAHNSDAHWWKGAEPQLNEAYIDTLLSALQAAQPAQDLDKTIVPTAPPMTLRQLESACSLMKCVLNWPILYHLTLSRPIVAQKIEAQDSRLDKFGLLNDRYLKAMELYKLLMSQRPAPAVGSVPVTYQTQSPYPAQSPYPSMVSILSTWMI